MEKSPKIKTVDVKELESKVKTMYRDVALNPKGSFHFEMGRDLALKLGYKADELDKIPSQAIDSFAGVGYFHDLADIKEGEKIVDLGSGSGMDVFAASMRTGKTGEVLGVDMTDEQLEKSEKLRTEHGFENISFHKSYIDILPFPDSFCDVVISNGVINLANDKAGVFREAARILKKKGRLAIADIVTEKQMPESITCNTTLWASCIGGATQSDSYLQTIRDSGFSIQTVRANNRYEFLSNSARGATKDFGVKSISILAIKE
jgi:arsenite methyltransferase